MAIDIVDLFRAVGVIAIGVCVYQIVVMLSYYRERVIPIRKNVSNVIAPPIIWTFAYHVAVCILLIAVGGGFVHNAILDRPGNVLAWFGPVIVIAMTVILNNFVKFYGQTLNEEYWKQQLPNSDSFRDQ